MKLNVTAILRNPGEALEFDQTESLEMLEGGIGTVVFDGPVHMKGSVQTTNGILELDAMAEVRYNTQCDRCCETVSGALSVHVREDLMVRREGASTPPVVESVAEEPYSVTGHELVLDVIAAEALLLEAPVYNLCQEACRGLCPECGTNLNRNACDCGSRKPVDPRLEALKGFSDPDEN